jgi:hypothetical protein
MSQVVEYLPEFKPQYLKKKTLSPVPWPTGFWIKVQGKQEHRSLGEMDV